uniref:Uncharacterized protein n=1 Tax=Setaria viridis TaxID=4556 RepID=A0A4U6U7I6_SETVI|nr:hypothetical protein SEVIR_6G090100v2 [Setaria viridis]
MVGSMRKLTSICERLAASGTASGSESRLGSGRGRRRGRPQRRGEEEEEEEEEVVVQRPRGKGKVARPPLPEPEVVEEEEEEEEELPSAHASGDDEQEEAEEEEQQEQEGDGEAGDAQSKIWLRGPSSLLKCPIPEHLRPLIKPVGTNGGDHNHKANGILGLLCRVHFPGLVAYAGQQQPAYTWDHYIAAPDVPDRQQRRFPNIAERVKAKLWDFYRCQEGFEAKAKAVCDVATKKLVKDMHYEARIQAIIEFHAQYRRMKVRKEEARIMNLTKDQFMRVPPWWCRAHIQCWEKMVDVWLEPGWLENHLSCRQRRLQMPTAPHHQGSLSLDEYREKWSASHDGRPCSQLKAWVLSKKGKATADINFNPDDPSEAYNHPSIHSRVSEYTKMAREVHGPDFDPSSEDIDGEIMMRVGGGKKHDRYWIGDGIIDTASTPTLSQIRARSTDSSPAIRPRPTTSQFQMEALQAQVEEARKKQEEMAAQMEDMRWRMEEENRMRMDQMFQYMQNFASSMGQSLPPPPPMLFPPPQPPTTTPNQSAASNNEDQDLSQWSPWPPRN